MERGDIAKETKKMRVANDGDSSIEEQGAKYVANNRGRALTREERLDILLLQANLRSATAALGRKEPVTNKIARLLGRSCDTVGKVWSDFVNHQTVFVAEAPGNRSSRPVRLPRSREMQVDIRLFIRTRSETRERTVAKDVMQVLVEAGYLQIDAEADRADAAANRCSGLSPRVGTKAARSREACKNDSIKRAQAR